METGKNLVKQKKCEFKPIKLKNGKENEPIIGLLPPDPLYTNLLGPGNDAIETLEKKHAHEMKEHFLKLYLKKKWRGSRG